LSHSLPETIVFVHALVLGEAPTVPAARDSDLVRAAQGGDRAAFGLLYERYGAMVHGVLLARVAWEDADDLLQDVFLTALERLRSLRDADAFGGWLAAIARNRATDHHRRRPPAEAFSVDDLAAEDRGPGAEALAALDAIKALPAAYRETLTLRLVEGMTGPEIAARTGLTPRSVRVNLHRGMKQLRKKLESTREER
jgi:RNA polymerase sigma-70 factor (ECF subfamily)